MAFKSNCLLIVLFHALTTIVFMKSPTHAAQSRPCQSNDAFYFNVQPKGISVREGGRAFLECNVSNHCNIQFHWTLNEQTIINTTRRYQNGSNLVITRVNRTLDGAEFHCIATLATTTVLSKQSQPAVLSIQWISDNATVNLASPPEEELRKGRATELQLKCNVSGSEEPTIKWFLNSRRIKKSTDRVTFKQRKLIIQALNVNDNGVYSCEADNSAGVVRSRSNFILAYAVEASTPEIVPKIVALPKDFVGKVDGTALFGCRYENADSISWRKVENDDLNIGTGENQRIRQLSNDSLLLTELKSNDAGTYECVGFGKNGIKQAYAATLVIASLDSFSAGNFEPPRDWYVVGQNKRFEVTCVPPKGYPEPFVYWTKNREKLTSSGRVRSMEDLRLIIDGAKSDDKGEYECVAENMAGVKKGAIKLYISRPPEIEYHPASLVVEEGASASFDCKYKGNEYPVTVVEWEKSGEPLTIHHRDQRIKAFGNNGTLIIDQVTLADQGDYQCFVKTGDQKSVASIAANLTVREKLKFVPKPVDKKLENGTSSQIPCRATGHIVPTVKWYRTGILSLNGSVTKIPSPQSEFSSNIRVRSGLLYFHPVRFEDAGTYMCVAVSGQGVINETIKVEVFISPEFVHSPKNVTVDVGANAMFHCVVRGEPPPTVQWFFETLGEAEWKFPVKKFPNNTILLRNVTMEHGGRFVCMAGNKGGFKRQEAVLCIKAKGNISTCGGQFTIVSSSNTDGSSRNNVVSEDVSGTAVEPGGLTVSTIAIAAGSAASYILMVLALVICCAYRRRKIRERKTDQPPDVVNGVAGSVVSGHSNHSGIHATTVGGDSEILLGRIGNGTSPPHAQENGHHHSARSRVSPTSTATSLGDRLQYPRSNLEFKSQLGSGIFGDVHIMKIVRSKNVNELHKLLVAKFFTSKDENIKEKLDEEVDMYAKLDHPNVVKLIGVSYENDAFIILFEYLEYGNLKHYLQASRMFKNNGLHQAAYPPPLSADQIVSVSYQVAQGMEYLSNQRYVHKDLAARNVLLSPDYLAKITNLSLSNDQFVAEYYTYRNVVKPLRWMPDEAFLDDDFSMKSDVWSFGVFVWELYTVGELPYQMYNNEQVIERMKSRQLQLTVCAGVPSCVRELLAQCWAVSPKDRPTFAHIREALERVQVECVI